MSELSILIITYNRPEDTLALLQNLRTQHGLESYVTEILLLNNASTVSYAPVEDFIAAHKDLPVRYIPHHENLGVAGGRNFLIERAQSPYLLVLDDDVEFAAEDAIEKAAGMFRQPEFQQKNTAVITLNIFYHDSGERQKTALPHKQYEEYKDKERFFTYYFTGAAHLMRRELFERTGLYPSDFFYGMEEYDLSYRILQQGYTIAYDSAIKVWHKESPKGRVTNKQKVGMMWLNKSKVAWRYLPVRYFYSTLLMWSLQYLRNTGFDVAGAFRYFGRILKIPRTEKRTPVSKDVLAYLKMHKARLWY